MMSVTASLLLIGQASRADSPTPAPSSSTSPDPSANAATKALAARVAIGLAGVCRRDARTVDQIRTKPEQTTSSTTIVNNPDVSGERPAAVMDALAYLRYVGRASRTGTGTAEQPYRWYTRDGCGE
jgi:hypothetical protein